MLPLGGAVCSAALALCGDVDCRYVFLFGKKGKEQHVQLSGYYLHPSTPESPAFVGPTGMGPHSEVHFVDFFVPPGKSIPHVHNQQFYTPSLAAAAAAGTTTVAAVNTHTPASSLSGATPTGVRASCTVYSFCPPAVRLAALESFMRLCLQMQKTFIERQRRPTSVASAGGTVSTSLTTTSGPTSSAGAVPVPSTPVGQSEAAVAAACLAAGTAAVTSTETTLLFIPAMIEAVVLVITHDSCRRTRRGAAQLFLDVVQDAPPGRQAYAALSMGDPWLAAVLGCWDVDGVTLPGAASAAALGVTGRPNMATAYKDLIRSARGPQMRGALLRLWETCIVAPVHMDEVGVGAILLLCSPPQVYLCWFLCAIFF